jgi:hypothetical protein
MAMECVFAVASKRGALYFRKLTLSRVNPPSAMRDQYWRSVGGERWHVRFAVALHGYTAARRHPDGGGE